MFLLPLLCVTARAQTIAGSFATSDTGAAMYTVPITVPPGPGGLQPKLALTYSSQAGNGMVGVGWSLAGLSSITRCPETMAHNGVTRGIKWDGADRYCLDGEYLVENPSLPNHYRTEKESFADVELIWGWSAPAFGAASFIVRTKDGLTMEYGNTADSRVVVTNTSIGRVWGLNRVTDAFGNYLTVTYTPANSTGQVYPQRIDYGGNNTVHNTPPSSVRFYYSTRGDPMRGFLSGAKIDTEQLLTSIGTSAGGNQLGLTYQLRYNENLPSAATRRSVLTSVTLLSPQQTTAIPLKITWALGNKTYVDRGSAGARVGSSWLQMDVNGDGKTDLVTGPDSNGQWWWLRANGTRYTSASRPGDSGFLPAALLGTGYAAWASSPDRIRAMDIDGDMLQDVVLGPDSNGVWYWLQSTGTTLVDRGVLLNAATTKSFATLPSLVHVMDPDGDGRQDLVLGPDSVGQWTLLQSNGSALVNKGVVLSVTTYGGWSSGSNPKGIYVMDLDGDGQQDFVMGPDPAGNFFWVQGVGATFVNRGIVVTAPDLAAYGQGSKPFQRVRAMDVNGDGRMDLVFGPDVDGWFWLQSTGAGLVNKGPLILGVYSSWQGSPESIRATDVNGDGMADLIIGPDSSNHWYALRSAGDKLIDDGVVATTSVSPGGWSAAPQATSLMDINGDGAADLVLGPTSTGNFYWLSSAGTRETAIGFDNSAGYDPVFVGYGYLSEGGFYTRGTPATRPTTLPAGYPVADFQQPIQVVTVVSEGSDSSGGVNSTLMTYGGLRIGFGSDGRGLLGFEWTQSQQTLSGLVQKTTYRQDFPFTGATATIEKHRSNGALISKSQSSYVCNNFSTATNADGTCAVAPGRRYFVGLSRIDDWGNDLNGAALPFVSKTLSYDAWGNVVTMSVATSPAVGVATSFQTVTTNVWGNDSSSSWHLGRLMRSTVSSTAAGVTLTRTAAFDYAPNGVMSKEAQEPGSSTLCLVTDYGYDAFGNRTLTRRRNCNGSVSTFMSASFAWVEAAPPAPYPTTYANFAAEQSTGASTDGFALNTVTNALGQQTRFTYNPVFGVVTSSTDGNGLVSRVGYDPFGRKVLDQQPDGTGTLTEYKLCSVVPGGTDTCPVIATHDDSTGVSGSIQATSSIATTPVFGVNAPANTYAGISGARTKSYLDARGRVIRVEKQGFDGRLIYVDSQYNALGQLNRRSEPYFAGATPVWTMLTYDELGRIISTNGPPGGGGTATNAYNGLVTSVTVYGQSGAQTTTETRNAIGQVISVTDAMGKSLSYAYDALGRLTKTVDSKGNEERATFDLRGRMVLHHDPDLQDVHYDYNANDRLIAYTSADGTQTTFAYDKLGRLTNSQARDHQASWQYDSGCTGAAVGRLCSELTSGTATAGSTRLLKYDAYGRPISEELDVVNGVVTSGYLGTMSYDSAGRLAVVQYPAGGPAVRSTYNAYGYLATVENASTGLKYYSANSADARGQILQMTYGNGVVTRLQTDAVGRVTSVDAQKPGQLSLSSAQYTYDGVGNLRTSYVQPPNWQGYGSWYSTTYDYDPLNRLVRETRGISPSSTVISWSYDELGNILSRSDVGTYSYPPSGTNSVRPHAVSGITGTVNGVVNPTYQYDGQGNFLSGGGRSVTWSSFNKPLVATRGANSVSWKYGADRQRIQETHSNSGLTTTYLQGSMFYVEEDRLGSSYTYRNFINANGATVAVVKKVNGVESTQYWHGDRLGSVIATTDAAGNVIERFDYEPFGKRRINQGQTDPWGTLTATSTNRGFTGHEMLDDIGLVHMNGRIYDPAISRFLSADPTVQAPKNLQSYNRYTYGWNNPLAGTDPSGYSWLSKLWGGIWHSTIGRIVITVVVAYFTAGLATVMIGDAAWASATVFGTTTAGNIVAAAAGGFAGGLVGSGGNLQAGLEGAVSGVAFSLAGGIGQDGSAARLGAHAAAGCVTGALNGNGCARGAVASFASKWMDVQLGQTGVHATIVSAMSGGIASTITGGKFINGAVSGAFADLFNRRMHPKDCAELDKKIDNLKKQLDSAWEDIEANPESLPQMVGPNERLQDSVRGHYTKINDYDSNLRKREREWDEGGCGDPPPPAAPAAAAGAPSASPPTQRNWSLPKFNFVNPFVPPTRYDPATETFVPAGSGSGNPAIPPPPPVWRFVVP